jgi:hypothetical protein
MMGLVGTGWRVYCCDTDGLKTDAPPSAFDRVARACGQRIGDECGDWGVEGEHLELVPVAPKVYATKRPEDSPERAKIRAKGQSIRRLTWKDLLDVVDGAVKQIGRDGLKKFRSTYARGEPTGPYRDDETRTLRVRHLGKRRHPSGGLSYEVPYDIDSPDRSC